MSALNCPHCGALPAFNGMAIAPEQGDVSVCSECFKLSVFLGIGQLKREPTPEEAAVYAASPRIQQTVADLRVTETLEKS